MSLRIACDLDGTLADLDRALQREAEQLFGEGVAVTPAAVPSRQDESNEPVRRGLTKEEMGQLSQHVTGIENFWASLTEIEPGAVAEFGKLASQYRWEVIFLTQRPPGSGDTAQVQSQRWLEIHGFSRPSVFVMKGSRGRVAHALSLDVVIDDRPSNCLDVATDSTAKPLLVWRVRKDAAPREVIGTSVATVHSMIDALGLLERLTHEHRAPKSFIGRVLRAIQPKST